MYEYNLGGISRDDVKNMSYSDNFVVYTVSANKNYSVFFEVYTSAGVVNGCHNTFLR